MASFCISDCFSSWVTTQFNGNKDKVIWGLMETVPDGRYQPPGRLVRLLSNWAKGLLSFDPVIQFGGLYNKKIVVKKQVFEVRVIWFKNFNSPFISWATLNTYINYLTSLCLSFLICRLQKNMLILQGWYEE